jgi:soluble P-type ATPase
MIEIDVPGRGLLRLSHLVLDVNGTLAVDGLLIDGVPERLAALRERLTLHLLTADTHVRHFDLRLVYLAQQLTLSPCENNTLAA